MYDSRDREPKLTGYITEDATNLYTDMHQQRLDLMKEEENRALAEAAAAERERDEAIASYNEYAGYGNTYESDRSAYLDSVRNALLCEAMFKVYKASYPTPLSEASTRKAKDFIMNYIKEHGAREMLHDFATKNLLLSEMGRVVEKSYNRLLEKCDECENDEVVDLAGIIQNNRLTQDISDEFYTDLADVDVQDAADSVKEKVSDAVADFIDTNASAKMDYQEILDNAKDQIDNTDDPEMKEDIQARAEAQIIQMQNNAPKKVFQLMVESLTKQVFKNEQLRNIYIKEGATVDMDSIVENAQIAYTMLEMINTLNIEHVNEKYISKYLDALEQ